MGSTELLKQATGIAKHSPIKDVRQLLEDMKPQLALALPRHLKAERMIRVALTALRQNPDLATCDPQSLLACVMVSAQLGLEIGVGGQAYLVPFNDRKKGHKICTFIPGWQGYVDLVSRSGRASVWTGAVREGDEFDAELGAKPYLVHRPDWDGDSERSLKYVYAVGRQTTSDVPVIDVWGVPKVIKHRDRYNKVGDRHYSYANTNNFEMYARKLPLLQVIKYLPKSIELQTAATLEYAADRGEQKLDIQTAAESVEGVFSVVSPEAQTTIDHPDSVAEAWKALGWAEEQGQSDLREQGGTVHAYLQRLNRMIDEQNS